MSILSPPKNTTVSFFVFYERCGQTTVLSSQLYTCHERYNSRVSQALHTKIGTVRFYRRTAIYTKATPEKNFFELLGNNRARRRRRKKKTYQHTRRYLSDLSLLRRRLLGKLCLPPFRTASNCASIRHPQPLQLLRRPSFFRARRKSFIFFTPKFVYLVLEGFTLVYLEGS